MEHHFYNFPNITNKKKIELSSDQMYPEGRITLLNLGSTVANNLHKVKIHMEIQQLVSYG